MASPIELVVGLGNPGPQYEQTRHNAGFWFVEAMARAAGASFRTEPRFHGQVCRMRARNGAEVWLLKPETFMNRSGQSIGAFARFYKLAPEQILVAHDELDLAPGVVRLKQGGGHGGHNGLRDTVAHLSGNNFSRLRLGIGHPGSSKEVVNYVLAKPAPGERELIEQAIEEALDALPLILDGETQRAMNLLHIKK